MSFINVLRAFGYIASIALFIVGLLMITGIVDLFRMRYYPANVRITFGAVFVLYGIFRFVRLWYSRKQNDDEDD